MSGLLPSTPDLSKAEEAEPRVIGVDSESADDLLAAMSSGTARRILSGLHDEPGTPSAVADRVGTSLQNAQYHLGRLEDAGLIHAIDTIYSEKGREMTVYAPTDKPLVVVAGPEEDTTTLRTALTTLLGGLGVLAVVSLLIQTVLRGFPFLGAGGADGGADVGMAAAPEATETAAGGAAGVMEATRTPTAVAAAPGGPLDGLLASVPPGGLFFAGGAAVLLVGFAVWYVRHGRL